MDDGCEKDGMLIDREGQVQGQWVMQNYTIKSKVKVQ